MNIAVRLEGGAGDCLLANRFMPAIKERHPDAKIHAFIDSEGKTFQKEVLELCYSHFYESIQVIPRKKYKEFWVDCQFGTDNYYGALENVPDEWLDKMQSMDKFYDLHIDSLKWTGHDFDWLRYFRFFPKPSITAPNQKKIILHLVSSTSDGHRLTKEYITELATKICNGNTDHEVIAIATEDSREYYQGVSAPNFSISVGDIGSVVRHLAGAACMVSTDSGFRYLAYGYGIPTFTFSKHCTAPYSAIPSHLIRWLIFPETCFPLNFNASYIAGKVKQVVEQKASILVPYVDNFDMQCVKRDYTINQAKTILRE